MNTRSSVIRVEPKVRPAPINPREEKKYRGFLIIEYGPYDITLLLFKPAIYADDPYPSYS